MRKARVSAVLAGAAFVAGWVYRRAFPKIVCPKCGSQSWRRLGGGLKECRDCSWKFFMQLPGPPAPGSKP
jgi:DNA-directed RNA polymerase subunit RPC12/RpoP